MVPPYFHNTVNRLCRRYCWIFEVPLAQSGAVEFILAPSQHRSAVVKLFERVVVQVTPPAMQVVAVPPVPTLPLQQLGLTCVASCTHLTEAVVGLSAVL